VKELYIGQVEGIPGVWTLCPS